MGGPGAAGQILQDELKARGIEFGMAIDECGGVAEIDGKQVATNIPC